MYHHAIRTFRTSRSLNGAINEGHRNYFRQKLGLSAEELESKDGFHRFLNRWLVVPIGGPMTWHTHVSRWDANSPIVVKYEEMITSPLDTLTKALQALRPEKEVDKLKLQEAIDEFSFEKLTGRKPGQEDQGSFVRKGVAGDWCNYFDRQSATLFAKKTNGILSRFGYERNDSWVENLPPRENSTINHTP